MTRANQSQTRSLYQLLAAWRSAVFGTDHPKPPPYNGPDVQLSAIVEHTAHVKSGACFVARVRTGTDGHPYIGQAVENGASLILGQRDPVELSVNLDGVPYLRADDTAVAEAWLAAAWYGFPSHDLVMIGVTGTDGKTTTANLLFSILNQAGLNAGLLSTVKAVIGDEEEPLALHVTTPEAPVVQSYLRRMVDAGASYCILEATSHGLAQDRVGAIDFDVAVVTNITHEHLDYHGDFEGYFGAKEKLFRGLGIGNQGSGNGDQGMTAGAELKRRLVKTAVLNRDDGSYDRLAAIPAGRHLTYGLAPGSDVTAEAITYGGQSTKLTLRLPSPDPPRPLVSTLVGQFNLYNMLAAAATGHALDMAPEVIAAGLYQANRLNGRMERIDRGQPFLVLVDFAHTPNALEQAIAAGRSLVDPTSDGRVITVFGSAGKRDVEKRRLMAQISARDANLTVLTAEDPRTEALDDILAMMAEGCASQDSVEGVGFWRVPDRGQAIYFALSLARPADVLLICGKGHEQSMCFGATEYPWDDVQATEAALDAFLTGQPMVDLGLPTFEADE
ncbi:MAG: UDP-N-acetylmuramoyl-L-alanyl-D-glutamate--2,6-diaminopimelate ligase [Chloroflexota bacterium]|nr:MAG: UDP-N-acetylmuramoyl-L-alanyl-D-glutamate--2,6-diaminopimelate ligase [Chloroflexota bacterium]